MMHLTVGKLYNGEDIKLSTVYMYMYENNIDEQEITYNNCQGISSSNC